MKGKLVIIGANDFQNQLILKAKSLGYETHVFAWKDGAIGEKTADYFYPISIIEKDEILEKCKEIKPDGICSIASDLATITVNYVAEKLSLPSNPISITSQCTNKYEMRKKMKENNVKTPAFIKVSEDPSTWKLENMHFPLIVKPTDRSGSRGITKIYKESELENAIKYSTKDSFEKKAIVEEFIEGDEYSCECISYKGEHHFLAFTKKYTTGAPNFIETGHCEPSDIKEEYQQQIINNIYKALTALGIQNGASHTEFKIDKNGNFGIIEIGARMGGDCIGSDLVQISTGYDFLKMVIDVSCGKKPDFTKTTEPTKAVIKFIFTQSDLDEMNEFQKKYPEQIYRISDMEVDNIGNTHDSSSRVGYYIYTPEKNNEKEKIIVIGSAGNIGMYFIDYLNQNLDLNKYEIIATGTREEYPYDFYNGKYIQLNINNKEDFSKLPNKNVRAVVDLAGVLPAYLEKDDPNKYIDVNIKGTLNILEYCRQTNVDRILYTQTWADLNGYLKDKKPLKPDWPRKPIRTGDHAIYAVTKCAAVDLIECYHHMYGIKNFIFRLPNIYEYSPEIYYYVDGEKKYISYRYMIQKAIKGEDIELWGNPNLGKDVVYIKDLCQMMFKVIFIDRDTGVYNAGTGIKTTMREQIEGIIEVFSPKNKPSKIIECPEKRDCDDFVMDIENAKEELGYEPKYNYLEYLKDYKKEMELNRFVKKDDKK